MCNHQNSVWNNFIAPLLQVQSLNQFKYNYHLMQGKWWCGWLRNCATSRKVAGSIPDGVIRIFH
jgi:hypothetical protein